MNTFYRVSSVILLLSVCAFLWHYDCRPVDGQEESVSKPDLIPMPTLGGKQFWSDELFFHQWRIQRKVHTDQYRLLDERNLRHASGNFDHCLAVLEGIKRDKNLPPMSGKAVVVLHGLGRSRSSMNALCKYLRERGGYQVFNVEYPTTQYDMADHSKTLRRLLNRLDGVKEINFIAHSMGNIVIRHYLGSLAKAEKKGLPEADRRVVERFGRFVMLAPPNNGSRLASLFTNNMLFKQIAGEAGQQLGDQWSELEKQLVAPPFQFGIVAGGKNNGKGYNPLLEGDNDGVISVETTKLAGAHDFIVTPTLHSFIMDKPPVQKYVLRFLRHGWFVSETERQPLEKKP